uniref:Uncharacterized protein n=1 Tax=Meloidogyne enterolobii TaxID=390850 RepID=A0A6V7VQ99_MELEN|nr:unnamed protein product [Meloidogyne enterolobii]
MLYFLPIETKLYIFKCLNYEELCLIKQTNLYFYNFINKYEGELAREKFYKIDIWKNGLENPIPLYLPVQDSNNDIVIALSKDHSENERFLLQLPTFIRSINDFKIVYYYLNR